MKNNYSYAQKKLNDAVYTLTVGQGDVRSRLVTVHLACHTLTSEDFRFGRGRHIKNSTKLLKSLFAAIISFVFSLRPQR